MQMRRNLAVLVLSCSMAPSMVAGASAQTPAELALRIERLEAEVRTLTGLVDQLTFQVEQLQALLNALNGGGNVPGAAAVQTPAAPATETPPLNLNPGAAAVVPQTPQPAVPGQPLDLTRALAPGGNFNIEGGAAPATDPAPGPVGDPVPAVPADPVPPPAVETPAVALTGDAQTDYDAAYQHILAGNYAEAEAAFGAFLTNYPGHALTVDAQFWVAESMFSRGNFRDAANQFYDAFVANSEHPRAPDMLLKLGISLARLGQIESACGIFEQVTLRYPNASNAIQQRLAAERTDAGC